MYIEVDGMAINNLYNKEIILFGAGSYGLHALEEFEKVGANIIGFVDNNPKLSGTKLNQYTIMYPDKLQDYPKAFIIITSTYEDEIRTQLKKMNIPNPIVSAKVGVLHKVIRKEQFKNTILSNEQINKKLYDSIKSNQPFLCGRLGSVELECISHYLYFLGRSKGVKLKPYPGNVKTMMNINAGFFPPEDKLLDRFSELYLNDIQVMDFIWSMWFSYYEDKIYHEYYPKLLLANYDETVFPINFDIPWTKALEGKRVLVIHPFEESIKSNYKKRKQLFSKTDFLPEFELITLKAIQSNAGCITNYENWFEALKYMQEQIQCIDFDIALIGAGAYGLPLGAFIKRMGKQAIHIGGILQLFFGIKGKAWNKLNVYNEFWTSPLEDERPEGYKLVEAGRYW